ncbi:uncharacterized protein LOC119172534 isoform X3 [Rhipicephalus microplus]|uniref:uncharacterized protein LOC119172534 isoform X3 n=1 Tax=Rhipicephalus microplus TaxID=6941 RepID=UPI003F6B4C8E
MYGVTSPSVIYQRTFNSLKFFIVQTKFRGPFEFELTRVDCILKGALQHFLSMVRKRCLVVEAPEQHASQILLAARLSRVAAWQQLAKMVKCGLLLTSSAGHVLFLCARTSRTFLRRDVDAPNRGGWTPLMHAACSGQRDTLRLLLELGANVNMRGGRHGRTAAINAAMYGYHECIALLHEYGADLELRDCEDRTALFHAAALGHVAVVQLLVDLGVNINCVEHFSGHSPLSIAADENHDSVVEILLNVGSRFSRATTNGSSSHPFQPGNISKTSPCGRARRSPEVESLVLRCANLALQGALPQPDDALDCLQGAEYF